MTQTVKHKKAKLPIPCTYQEKKVTERKLKDCQHIITTAHEEEKYQTWLDNIQYNVGVKQFAFWIQVDRCFVRLESED